MIVLSDVNLSIKKVCYNINLKGQRLVLVLRAFGDFLACMLFNGGFRPYKPYGTWARVGSGRAEPF